MLGAEAMADEGTGERDEVTNAVQWGGDQAQVDQGQEGGAPGVLGEAGN